MTKNLPSKYSESSYIIIGLDLTSNYVLTFFNIGKSFEIKQVFNTFDDVENFLKKQINNEKVILITSSELSNEQLIKLKKHSQITAIYSYSKSSDFNEELKCIYTKWTENKYWKIFFDLFKKVWFILGIGIVSLFAYLFPNVAASHGILHSEITIKIGCVVLVFFINGLSLNTRMIIDQLRKFRLHIVIQLFILVFVPFIVFGIALLLIKTSINKTLINGIILMACTTTAISSNVIMTKNAAGNEHAALLNVLIANILGTFTSPALIYFFMTQAGISVVKQSYDIKSYGRVIGKLSLSVLLPLIVGLIINHIWTEKIMRAKEKYHFTIINSVALLLIVWSVFSDLFQSGLLKAISTHDLLIIIALNASIYISLALLAFFIARLPNPFVCRKKHDDEESLLVEKQEKPKSLVERWRFSPEDTVAFMFCGAAKTLAKGVPLITAVFSNNNHGVVGLLTLPLILYNIEQLIISSIEVIFLRRWVKKYYETHKKEDN